MQASGVLLKMAYKDIHSLLLDAFCLLLLAGSSCALTVVEVEVSYDNGLFTLLNASNVEFAELPSRGLAEAVYERDVEIDSAGDYFTLSLESEEGGLYAIHERYPKTIYYDSSDYGSGAETLNESNDIYYFPYDPEAIKLSIYDANGAQIYTTGLFSSPEGKTPSGSDSGENEALQQRGESESGAGKPHLASGPDYLFILMIVFVLLVVVVIINSRRGSLGGRG